VCNRISSLYPSDDTRWLTAGFTGAGAGVDSVWEQKKLEARKMLENVALYPSVQCTLCWATFMLTKTVAEKRYHRQHAQVLHTTYSLAITKKSI